MKCICGFEGNNIHAKVCDVYKVEVDRITNNIRKNDFVEKQYKKLYSVTKLCEIVRNKEKTQLYESKLRIILVEYLKEINIYEGLNGKNYLQTKKNEFEQIMMERYGVINPGQIEGNGWAKTNKIPYKKLMLDKEFAAYRKAVAQKSKGLIKKLKKQNKLPTHCEYTGVLFADETEEQTNPNHPLKRTADHKMPVIEGFLNGITVEEIARRDNIAFCIRYSNTLKGATTLDVFKEKIAIPLREKLINEGYECKKIR